MHRPRTSDIIRAHQPGIVQVDLVPLAGYEDGVAVLGLDEVAVGEVGAVEGAGEAVPGQGGEEGCGAVGRVAGGVGEGAQGLVDGADAGEALGCVLRRVSGRGSGREGESPGLGEEKEIRGREKGVVSLPCLR